MVEEVGTETPALSRARAAPRESTTFLGLPREVWRWLRGAQRARRTGTSEGWMEAQAQKDVVSQFRKHVQKEAGISPR